MKVTHKTAAGILWCEAAGFLLLILMSWLDEYHASWHESAVESAAVAGVGIVVLYLTKRLVARLYYLEGFVRVCAWCRKIDRDDKWIPLEQYFSEGFNTKTTHGMCPECAALLKKQIEEGQQPGEH